MYKDSFDNDDINLPQFSLAGVHLGNTPRHTGTGEYSQLQLYFIFRRSIGFYMIQIYLPSILIVIISWVSFWFSRDATPARVALGVTTVLTMTTLMTTTNAQMPKVSYIKSIDMYLGVCFIMVFASLLEYAAVGYLNKKLRMRRERSMQKTTAVSMGKRHSAKPMSDILNVFTHHGANAHPSRASHVAAPMGQLSSSYLQGGGMECDCDIDGQGPMQHPVKIPKPHKVKRRGGIKSLTPSMIDKHSRAIFPILFAIFNCVYWAVLYKLSSDQLTHYITPKTFRNGSSPETDTCHKDLSIYTGIFVDTDIPQ